MYLAGSLSKHLKCHLGASNPVPPSFFYTVMLAQLGDTDPVGRRGKGTVKEGAGEAHGSWVEGGLITHSTAPALPRAAPLCSAESEPPQPLKPRCLRGMGRRIR